MTAVQEQAKIVAEKRLKGKVALVTGSSRGIGAAIALRLADDGAAIAVNYVNNKDAAKQIVSKIANLGAKAELFKANVSLAEDSKNLIEEVSKVFGQIDILVNNAGVYETSPVADISLEHYQRLFDINVKGVITTTVSALKHIPDGGRIINISSGLARFTLPGASVYSATKAALETLTRVWAQELGKRHITVNAVAPGTTATDLLLQHLPEHVKQMLIAKTALERLGEPEDIADVVAFLASADGRWVTGQTINCNGGLVV